MFQGVFLITLAQYFDFSYSFLFELLSKNS